MTTTITQFTEFIKQVKGVRPYTLTFSMVVLSLYLFKDDVSHVINTKLLKEDRVVTQLKGNILVNASLQDLMMQANADRAYIFRFHNGDKYYNGTHKNKFSCDYEVVRKGVARQAERLQDIPVTLYPKFIQSVINETMIYPDINEIDDIVTRSALTEQGIKGIAVAPYFRDGHLFAMIGIDYTHEPTEEELKDFDSNQQMGRFREITNQIGKILE